VGAHYMCYFRDLTTSSYS
jgi:hypothetical protein